MCAETLPTRVRLVDSGRSIQDGFLPGRVGCRVRPLWRESSVRIPVHTLFTRPNASPGRVGKAVRISIWPPGAGPESHPPLAQSARAVGGRLPLFAGRGHPQIRPKYLAWTTRFDTTSLCLNFACIMHFVMPRPGPCVRQTLNRSVCQLSRCTSAKGRTRMIRRHIHEASASHVEHTLSVGSFPFLSSWCHDRRHPSRPCSAARVAPGFYDRQCMAHRKAHPSPCTEHAP